MFLCWRLQCFLLAVICQCTHGLNVTTPTDDNSTTPVQGPSDDVYGSPNESSPMATPEYDNSTDTPGDMPAEEPMGVPAVDTPQESTPTITTTTVTLTGQVPSDPPIPAPSPLPIGSPFAIPSTVPDEAPQATPLVVPQDAPVVTPQIVPVVSPEVVPEGLVPVVPPQVVPREAPQTVPVVSPQAVPIVTPQIVPAVTPQVVPIVTPQVVLVSPQVVPQSVPEAVPEADVGPQNEPPMNVNSTPEAVAEPVGAPPNETGGVPVAEPLQPPIATVTMTTVVPVAVPSAGSGGGTSWCNNDATCRIFGDTAANCTADNTCVCSPTHQHVSTGTLTAYICVEKGSTAAIVVKVVISLIFYIDCSIYRNVHRVSLQNILEGVLGGIVGAMRAACGSLVVMAEVEGVDPLRLTQVDLKSAVNTELDKPQYAFLKNDLGVVGDTTMDIGGSSCTVPNAVVTFKLPSGVCSPIRCEDGFALTALTCSFVTPTLIATSDSDDSLTGASIAAIVIVSLLGVSIFAAIGFCVLRSSTSMSGPDEDDEDLHEPTTEFVV